MKRIFLLALLGCLFHATGAVAGVAIQFENQKLQHLYVYYPEDEVVGKAVDTALATMGKAFDIQVNRQAVPSRENFILVAKSAMSQAELSQALHAIPYTGIQDDGFILDTGSGRPATIYARERLGLVYGLWEFLETLGFRFYMPGPHGTVAPSADVRLEKKHLLSNPGIRYRGVGAGEWSLLAYRANVNLDGVPDGYGRRIWGLFHTFEQLVPRESYGKKNPNLFAGSIPPFTEGGDGKLQLNTASTEVVDLVAGKLADLSKSGKYEMLTLAPNDSRKFDISVTSLSQDEITSSVDQRKSRRMLLFYDQVARKYKALGGTVPIRVGAYDVYTAPPKDTALKLESGLIPYVAHFSYCQLHAITDPGCPRNQRFAQLIGRWYDLSRSLYIYEYNYKHNWLELPWPIYTHTAADIRWYVQSGMIGYHTQFSPKNVFSHLLNYYITAKALWNPDVDPMKLRSEFFALFYKGVSDTMDQCYRVLEDEFQNPARVHSDGDAKRTFAEVFEERALTQALSLAKSSYEKAADPSVKVRTEMMVLWLKYALNMRAFLQGQDKDRNLNEAIRLVKEAQDKQYPIFSDQILERRALRRASDR